MSVVQRDPQARSTHPCAASSKLNAEAIGQILPKILNKPTKSLLRRGNHPKPRAGVKAKLGMQASASEVGGLGGSKYCSTPIEGDRLGRGDRRIRTGNPRVDVITKCPKVPEDILIPKNTWANKGEFDKTANKLAGLFNDNFAKYADGVSEAFRNAGPVAS